MNGNLPMALTAARWLTVDTFRQARYSGMLWLMLAISGIAIVFALSIRVTGGNELHDSEETVYFAPAGTDVETAAKSGVTVLNPEARMTLGFGLMPANIGRDAEDSLQLIQLILAGAVADTLGVLLALVFTAGFVPAFLDPASAAVLLAKPVPRWTLLTGKFFGVLSFVAFQAVVFVFGTWLALGVATGYWNANYLLCIPLLLVHFAIFFSFSVLVAVCTRSTVASIVASIAFWLVCFGVNVGRHFVVCSEQLAPNVTPLPGLLAPLMEITYWVFPKPADFTMFLHDVLRAHSHFGELQALQAARERNCVSAELSVLTSLASCALILWLAARQLVRADY
jgi:ABC-type transport system involved in multi-copper enzyme maturation permease subunit